MKVNKKLQKKLEWEQKMQEKIWRLNHYYYIKTKKKLLLMLDFNKAQDDFFNRRALKSFILKARQLGFSTACLIDLLDDTIFSANTNSAIVAHKQDKVIKLFEIVKRAFEHMPVELKPRVSLENRNELYFPDLDSKIFVTMDTRSETVHNLHVSELAFIRGAEDMMAGTLESVPKEGKITFETTANGMQGYAFEEWDNKWSEFSKFFYPWFWEGEYRTVTTRSMEEILEEYKSLAISFGTIPDLQQRFNLDETQMEFYIAKMKRHKRLVVQEYPSTDIEAFISSGKGVFHMNDLQKHATTMPVEEQFGGLKIWELPQEHNIYVLGVDSAEGGGGDNAVIEVLNARTGNQAAEFADANIPPGELGLLSIKIAKYYNRAFIVPEMNNTGVATIDKMKMKYQNIYRREILDKRTGNKTEALGWRTTGTSKPLLVENLEEAVREQFIKVNSEEWIKEGRVFVRTDAQGKQGYGAEGSHHDDRVIALGLAYQGIKHIPKAKAPKSEAQRRLEDFLKRNGQQSDIAQPVNPSPMAEARKRYFIRPN